MSLNLLLGDLSYILSAVATIRLECGNEKVSIIYANMFPLNKAMFDNQIRG